MTREIQDLALGEQRVITVNLSKDSPATYHLRVSSGVTIYFECPIAGNDPALLEAAILDAVRTAFRDIVT